MKKYLAFILALLMTAAMLIGCGGASESVANDAMDYFNGVAEEEMMEAPGAQAPIYDSSISSSTTSDSISGEYQAQQKLIREVSIDAETEDLEALLSALTEQISALGGYIENQQIRNGSSYSSYRYRSATLNVRIPAENLDSFVGEVQGLSNVVNYNQSAKDVTLSYVATESRVAALEAEEKRLLELMDKAETMADLLEVEARLTEVRSDLESTASQLRVMANKVSYATVYLSLEQVEVYTEVEEPTVWERITGGFTRNLKNLGEGLVDFMVWAITYSPQLIFWAAVIFVGVSVFRRTVRKQKARKAPIYYPPEKDHEEKK